MTERVKRWTPGPYEYVECSDDFDEACGVGMGSYLEDSGCYATIHLWQCSNGTGVEEAVSTAKLFRAAPDLVEALELIVRRLQVDIDDGSRPDQWSMQALVDKAESALSCAYGETN